MAIDWATIEATVEADVTTQVNTVVSGAIADLAVALAAFAAKFTASPDDDSAEFASFFSDLSAAIVDDGTYVTSAMLGECLTSTMVGWLTTAHEAIIDANLAVEAETITRETPYEPLLPSAV